MFGRFGINFGFGQGGDRNSGVQGQIDYTVTGEGTQALSDMGWKKKENKYMGTGSLTEKESKE